ncbi:hypothetical protein QWO81_23995, partial [Salmonella enterica subsp. enterica serovar Typhimurium]|nr:hypothetical protein [Salmonella enterica subsp. enterica serovar Typhimurium]
MRLNSALVVNFIKSILGSVFWGDRCSAVGIRTGYSISVIRILIIEDYQTCATACWQKVIEGIPAVNFDGMKNEFAQYLLCHGELKYVVRDDK